MFKTALRELKFHPGRYVATLLAIAISVCFMAASSIITATESHAMAMQDAYPYTKADLITDISEYHTDSAADQPTLDQVTEVIESAAGVAAAEPLFKSSSEASHGSAAELVNLTVIPSHKGFNTLELKSGNLPQGAQIVINSALSKKLGVNIGDSLSVDGAQLTVSGISTDPTSRLLGNPVYVSHDWFAQTNDLADMSPLALSWLVGIHEGFDPKAVATNIQSSLAEAHFKGDIQTEKDYVATAATSYTHDIDVLKYILWVFAGIALIVGLITISNTFSILLAQRRRQIGLMRVIGASGAQVRHSIWGEALILGAIGGLLGIALAAGLSALLGLYTGSVSFGIVFPAMETVVSFILGVVITLIACVTPARHATRVSPMEALQTSSSEASRKRVSVARGVICGIFAVAGIVGSILALRSHDDALALAVGSAMCLAVGVLFGARLFVPWILRGLGAIVKHWGPSSRVAAKNVVRDPARASATATALMLAVGLIVTLQVGAASVEKTVLEKLQQEYPVDVTLTNWDYDPTRLTVEQDVQDAFAKLPGVNQKVGIPCKWVNLSDTPLDENMDNLDRMEHICSYVPQITQVATAFPATMPDSEIWVGKNSTMYQAGLGSRMRAADATLTLPSTTGTIDLHGVESPIAEAWSYDFVSPRTYDSLPGTSTDNAVIFISLDQNANIMTFMRDANAAVGGDNPRAALGGYLAQKYVITQVMSILVGAMTALLGVAVLIALVGVGNTLTLSVIERARESAILRAVGAQRRQLKVMLLIEALLLTLTGAVVGLVAGSFFGWLGAKSMVQQFKGEGIVMSVQFALNWPQTLGLLGILVVAAALASILPGRRAAKASPVEALAEA